MNNIYLLGECMIELMSANNSQASTKPTCKSPTGNQLTQGFAGDVFNTAVYLKRLFADKKVHLVTAVGDDNFSDEMVNYFEQEALTTDCVFRSSEKIPGLYSIQLDEFGERSFTYWRSDSAARYVMNFIDQQVTNDISKGDIFFFSGISLGVILPQHRAQFWSFIDTLKQAGVTIAFDLNYRPKLWANKEEAKTQFKQAFDSADVLLPGVDDFAAIFGLDAVEDIIAFFNDYDFQELVIKNGEQNVFCISEEGQEVVDVTLVTNVVDTTSAGDSFNGAYLGARMAGSSVAQAVDLANQVAGFVIQHKGAIVDKAAFSSRFN